MSTIALDYIDDKAKELERLAIDIWENPEIAFTEVKACEWTAQMLREEGFDVEVGKYGMPTSIRATWGKGKPFVGFLGEYDALPSMSQKVSGKKEAIKDGDPGHACQHNLLGVAHLGAAIGLKKEIEERGIDGTVVFYGCPAEETLTGKVFMAREGAFRDLDIFYAYHPGPVNMVMRGTMTALSTFKLHFKGITAHAGGDPHNGRSALDAVELTNVGLNYLREHVTDDVRMHYTITNGGQAPNIVPDKASAWYYVRALSRDKVQDTFDRLVKIAKGAAMMTETEVEIENLGGCYETMNNNVLADVLEESMKNIATPIWTDEEKEFAKELSGGVGMPIPGGKEIYLYEGPAMNGNQDSFGSTDVGDVQHIAPGTMFFTSTTNITAAGHSWQNTVNAGGSIGIKGMIYAAKIMADAGLKAMEDSSIIENAKKEFEISMKGKEYISPMPSTVKIPK